jgi:adenine-specific DNA methylase
VAATFVDSFTALQSTSKSALLFCHNSADLPEIPTNSVDFVITDPPYFDNIHYSELSNFFYVWLKLLTDHPAFASDLVPNDAEAIVNAQHDKGEDEYRELMTAVFTEAHRVIKDSGRLIFTFHHINPRAWWTILAAIGDGGFQIVDTFPLRTEYQVNPHVRGKQALDSDMIFICAKRAAAVTPELSAGDQDTSHPVMRQLGQLLMEANAAWESQRLSPEEWERRMAQLGELNGKVASAPEYDLPATTQPRLFEKAANPEVAPPAGYKTGDYPEKRRRRRKLAVTA